jgi:threonine/homoserine/homoserine lactone efflux protein
VTASTALLSFAVVAGLMTIVPGLDTALVVRTAVVRGRRHGAAVALGINAGVLLWAVAAAVGMSALLVASRLAYDGLRLAGAAYLVWVGATMLWRTIRRRTPPPSAPPDAPRGGLARSSRGVVTNLLNPKIGVFYLATLPQFMPAHAPHLLMGLALAGVHDAEGILWFALLITVAQLARRFLDGGRARRTMDRLTGTVLIAFGLKLALSPR